MAHDTEGKLARVVAYVANYNLEKVERYARAGRRFAALDTATLKTEWVRAYRGWADDPTNDNLAREHEDREAELSLRDDHPPFDEVEAATEKVTASVAPHRGNQHEPGHASRACRACRRGHPHLRDRCCQGEAELIGQT